MGMQDIYLNVGLRSLTLKQYMCV